tara:strand:- start:2334 stop:2975 length:642 start_codon:yes stop_codon:yes gene_type:complete
MDSKGNKNKEDDNIPTKNKNLVILGTIITVMFASAGYGIYTGVKWIHGKVYPSLLGSIDVIENEEDDNSLNIEEVEDPDDSSPETTPEPSPEEKEDESQQTDTNQLGLEILESDNEEKKEEDDESSPQNNDPEVVNAAVDQAKVDSENLVSDLNNERMKLLEEFGDITKNELDDKQNKRLEDYQNTINEINKTLKTGGKGKTKRKTKKNKKKN